jgi:hypothetical protein
MVVKQGILSCRLEIILAFNGQVRWSRRIAKINLQTDPGKYPLFHSPVILNALIIVKTKIKILI